VREVRRLFAEWRGQLVDEEGIDWWDLTSLLIAPEALWLLVLRRVAAEIDGKAELWATRRGTPVRFLEILLNRAIQTFSDGMATRSAVRMMHYAGLLRRFSPAQFKEILLDKYDSGYRWRSHFAAKPGKSLSPVVLVPSAYGNVSRMASAYARLLPEQAFLLVATRQSGRQLQFPANVAVRDLGSYAAGDNSANETSHLTQRLTRLRESLAEDSDLQILARAGILDAFPGWIRNGLSARNAWREVFRREPVQAVFCGDDSNLYTRLPVMLAAGREVPTVDFHHGALDGRYILKDLPSDAYLAKSEMERDYLVRICGLDPHRVLIGAAEVGVEGATPRRGEAAAILFSEPYEVAGMRPEEVYLEILPKLCRVARENGRGVIVKLHPFENIAQRRKLLDKVLAPADAKMVDVADGPLTAELMDKAWFGVTVESTTVIDCLQHGVCGFLCGWLSFSSFGYGEQYARFGVGELLKSAGEIDEIPQRLLSFESRKHKSQVFTPVDVAVLQKCLTGVRTDGVRSAS